MSDAAGPERRAQRRAARRTAGARDRVGADRRRDGDRTVLVVAVARAGAVVSSPGWPRVQATFFDGDVAQASLPSPATAFWLNIRLFLVAGCSSCLRRCWSPSPRAAARPGVLPLRAARGRVHRRVPRHADLLVVLLVGFGVPGAELHGRADQPVLLAVVALMLSYGAYVAEVFRAGIESVHPSPVAPAALARPHATRRRMRHVVLPQAVRRVVPPLLNDFVSLQKDTGLVAVVGADRRRARGADRRALHFNFTPYVVAGLLLRRADDPAGPASPTGWRAAAPPRARERALMSAPCCRSHGAAQGVRRPRRAATARPRGRRAHDVVA